MPEYNLKLKIKSRRRNVLQDIERILKHPDFQKNLEYATERYFSDELRRSYIDTEDVEISANFSGRRLRPKKPPAPASSSPKRRSK